MRSFKNITEYREDLMYHLNQVISYEYTCGVVNGPRPMIATVDNLESLEGEIIAGKWDADSFDIVTDELDGVSIVLINNTNGKEDVKMNQAKEVKVENKIEGVVKMAPKNDINIVRKFDSVVEENGFKNTKMVVVVEDVVNNVALTKNNIGLIREGLRTHLWSGITAGAVDFMFFDYSAAEDTFTLRLSANRIEKQSPKGTKMAVDHMTKEARQEQMEQFIKDAEAHKALVEILEEDGQDEELELTEILPYEMPLPNANIFDEAGGDISADRRAELEVKAPFTGIDSSAKLEKALFHEVIKPCVGLNIKTKIETTKMAFLKLKDFRKFGTGKEYKSVSIAWLFKILDPKNFLILSDVPNKETLDDILASGLVVNVIVGYKNVGKDEEGKNILEAIYEDRLFKYVASSASKQRQERYILTCYQDRENIRKMLTFWSDEFDFGKKQPVAKSESRVGTHLSTGVCIGGMAPYAKRSSLTAVYAKGIEFFYVVIPDLTLADVKKMAGQTPAEGDDEIMLADGAGFHNEASGRLIEKKLRNPYAKVQQGRIGKGVTYLLEDARIKKHLEYIGMDVDLSVPVVFVTESMWKFNVGVDIMPFTVLRTSVEMPEKAFMCYETWNALNISSQAGLDTLKALAMEQYNFFKLTKNDDPGLFVHRLGTLAKINDEGDALDEVEDILEDKTLATSLFRFFYTNPGLARRSEYLIGKVNALFQRKIADMARGKLMVDGAFCIMVIDPGAWTGQPILKAGEVYVGGKTGEVLLARYPMVHMSEPQVMTAVDRPELSMFKGMNVIIFNVFDRAWEKMQGADFDGDACLVTFDKRVIALAVKNVESPVQEKKEAKKAILGWDSIAQYFSKNFEIMHPVDRGQVATIGKVNNIVAALLSSAHANGTFLSEETVRRTAVLAVAINDLIDAAKTGYIPPVDAWYFENYKYLPNWLAKSFQRPDGTFVNTWEVPTIDEDPESIYRKDTTSPLGRLANNLTPYLYKQFAVTGDTPSKTEDFVSYYDGSTIMLVESQLKGIKQEYSFRASAIWGKDSDIKDMDVKREKYAELVAECNERIRKVAATYDIITTAVAALRVGGAKGFAFKCFEEGVIALFESVAGKKYVKIKNGMEVPAGTEIQSFDGVQYMVLDSKSKDVQIRKFENAHVGKEVTIRLTGIQFDDIPVKSINDIKRAILASGKIVRGGVDYSGHHVAFAGNTPLGRITLERVFAASSVFAQGGYAEVLNVLPVLKKGEAFNPNAPVKYADLVVRYIEDPNGGNTVKDSSTAATTPSTVGQTAPSSFVLPSMPGASAPGSSSVVAGTPSTVAKTMSMEGINQDQALQMMGQLAQMFGFKLSPAKETPQPEVKAPAKEESKWPSMLPQTEDDGYWASLMQDVQ